VDQRRLKITELAEFMIKMKIADSNIAGIVNTSIVKMF
jgi:hypothetical protein